MNHKGYAVKELIILFAILGIVFTFAITRVSFAYQQADNEEELAQMRNNSLQTAAEAYVSLHKDKFQETETYFFGSDLVENHFLVDVEELGYNTVRFKVTHPEGSDEYTVEIVE